MANCKSVITLCDENFDSCGDLGVNMQELLTTEVSAMTTVKEFDNALCTELIDVKSRKTISGYPTLRALYERYVSSYQGLPQSSAFDYYKMDNFVSLVGDYWVDLIEQVIPSTTIWGSTIKYRNTVFDKDKFKYKKYTLIPCRTRPYNIEFPSPTYGLESTVGVTITDVGIPTYIGPDCLAPTGETTICEGVMIQQINDGSEFIGAVYVLDPSEPNPTGDTGGGVVVTECSLNIVSVTTTDVPVGETNTGSATVNYVGSNGGVTILWSNGATTPTINNLSAGTYSVTVWDNTIEDCSDTFNFVIRNTTPQIGDCAYGGIVFYLDGLGGGLVCAQNDITGGTINNHFYWNGTFPFTYTGTTSSSLGSGQANTNEIMSQFEPNTQLYAAEMANDFINYDTTCGGEYTDWYLPSIDELETLRVNLSNIGDLQNDYNFISQGGSPANYFSSTNSSSQWAWANTMVPFGGPFTVQMTKAQRVRAIRSF